MPSRTFTDRYCAKHNLPEGQYEQSVLKSSLHGGARLLYPLFACFPGYFTADRELVRAAGRCLSRWDFHTEVCDYRNHPDNRGFLRGTLKLRLSVRHLRRLVYEVVPQDKTALLSRTRMEALGS